MEILRMTNKFLQYMDTLENQRIVMQNKDGGKCLERYPICLIMFGNWKETDVSGPVRKMKGHAHFDAIATREWCIHTQGHA